MNLVLANLSAAFVLIPMVFLDELTDVVSQSLLRGMTTLISSASILGQLLIGMDQYLAVVNPLHYHRHINEARCRFMCASVWLISVGLAILCSLKLLSPYDQWIYLITAFILPMLLSFVIYCRIFVAARSNSIRTRRNSSCSMTQDGVFLHQFASAAGPGVHQNKYLKT